jgi:hypothetical protein
MCVTEERRVVVRALCIIGNVRYLALEKLIRHRISKSTMI